METGFRNGGRLERRGALGSGLGLGFKMLVGTDGRTYVEKLGSQEAKEACCLVFVTWLINRLCSNVGEGV